MGVDDRGGRVVGQPGSQGDDMTVIRGEPEVEL